tara:strand:+ start:1600 stop:1761 length:162 start_codon:yes stop_codon:yes gene_type:complete
MSLPANVSRKNRVLVASGIGIAGASLVWFAPTLFFMALFAGAIGSAAYLMMDR